jgi:hypothetical protein
LYYVLMQAGGLSVCKHLWFLINYWRMFWPTVTKLEVKRSFNLKLDFDR